MDLQSDFEWLRTTLVYKKWVSSWTVMSVQLSSGHSACLGMLVTFFYVPTAKKGIALRSNETDFGSLMIAHAVKMLTSCKILPGDEH